MKVQIGQLKEETIAYNQKKCRRSSAIIYIHRIRKRRSAYVPDQNRPCIRDAGKMQEDKVELKGVRFSEEYVSKNLTISTVVIETENGAKAMEKPKGTYITIEASNMDEEDEDYHREISEQLAKVLKQLISVKKRMSPY